MREYLKQPLTVDSLLQVRSNAICIYPRRINHRGVVQEKKDQMMAAKSKEKSYSGKVTINAARRIKKAVNLMCQVCETKQIYNPILDEVILHRLSFLTLTISENDRLVDGKEGYEKLLKPFLQWLTKTKGVRTYIWKAELQKRKQLHYHLTFPDWIHYNEIKSKWNYLQRKAGLIESFKLKHGHDCPNSTDIHAVYKVQDLEAYLCKYLSKESEDGDRINSKVWDCSENLKGVKYFTTQLTTNHLDGLDRLAKKHLCEIVPVDYVDYVKIKNNKANELLHGVERLLYNEYKQAILNYQRNRKRIVPLIRKKRRFADYSQLKLITDGLHTTTHCFSV